MTVSPAADRVTESFIDGEPVRSAGTYPNIDPSTGVTLGDVARAGDKEIDQAVAAARRASRESSSDRCSGVVARQSRLA